MEKVTKHVLARMDTLQDSNKLNIEVLSKMVQTIQKQKSDILITGEVPNNFCDKYSDKEYCSEVINYIKERKKFLKSESNLAYIHYEGEVQGVKFTKIDDNNIIFNFIEYIKLQTNEFDEHNIPIISEQSDNYTVNLIFNGKGWLIKTETKNEGYKNEVNDIPSDVRINTSDVSNRIAAFSYDRTAAAKYARDFVGDVLKQEQCKGYNNYSVTSNPTGYRCYPQDCANFTSQCLKKGGWNFIGAYSSSTSTSNWWYSANSTTGDTYTWKNAHGLNYFIGTGSWVDKNRNRLIEAGETRGTKTDNVLNLRAGDVVTVDWAINYNNNTCTGTDNLIDHIMIVTKVTSSNAYLTYHTNNRLDKPFTDLRYEARCTKKVNGQNVVQEAAFTRWKISDSAE